MTVIDDALHGVEAVVQPALEEILMDGSHTSAYVSMMSSYQVSRILALCVAARCETRRLIERPWVLQLLTAGFEFDTQSPPTPATLASLQPSNSFHQEARRPNEWEACLPLNVQALRPRNLEIRTRAERAHHLPNPTSKPASHALGCFGCSMKRATAIRLCPPEDYKHGIA